LPSDGACADVTENLFQATTMTLSRQLGLTISILFLFVFIGTFLIGVNNTRDYLSRQLESHAQDTATSLGLSLSTDMAHKDLAAMQAMVDAIFDRGYYREMAVEDNDGKRLIERFNPMQIEGVPAWFVRLMSLPAPRGEALIMNGWVESGKIWLTSHSGLAYRELWRTTVGMLSWFLGCAAVSLSLGMVAMRAVMKPLYRAEEQAEGICHGVYSMQSEIPKTRELERMVLAMNKMSARVKQMFEEQSAATEKLRGQAYLDPVTDVGNRRYFDVQLAYLTEAPEDFAGGALILSRLRDFKAFNDSRGYAQGDELLRQTADMIRLVCKDYGDCMIARLGGGDFAVILKHGAAETLENLAGQLCDHLALLQANGLSDSAECGCVGGALFRQGQSAADLLAAADRALSVAEREAGKTWYIDYSLYPDGLPKDGGQWREYLGDALRFHQVVLEFQPVLLFDGDSDRIMHREVLLRLRQSSDELLAAGVFLPMAERIGLASDFDRIAIAALFLRMEQEKHLANVYAVNITPASVGNPSFVDWLCAQLKSFPHHAGRLIFEIAEYGVLRDLQAVKSFVKRVRAYGARLSIDHFGRGFHSFAYLHSIGAAYIKIDGSFIRNIDRDEDNQFFVRELTRAAHDIDMKTIALNVETDREMEVLKNIRVDGIQGYLIGKPVSDA
jgi:diguanylate cyclase (GGDEF)-like protein